MWSKRATHQTQHSEMNNRLQPLETFSGRHQEHQGHQLHHEHHKHRSCKDPLKD